jgi:hypothetical protein
LKLFQWFREKFSVRGKALNLYRSGLLKAKKKDPAGAIAAYTEVIKLLDAPKDIIAMALFNRGLVYVANEEPVKGKSDLNKVLEMNDAPTRVKDMAKQKLIRMKNLDRKHDEY